MLQVTGVGLLYVRRHPLGVVVFTRLSRHEQAQLGDHSELVIPGESFGGLGYDQLAAVADHPGSVCVSRLADNEW